MLPETVRTHLSELRDQLNMFTNEEMVTCSIELNLFADMHGMHDNVQQKLSPPCSDLQLPPPPAIPSNDSQNFSLVNLQESKQTNPARQFVSTFL